MESTLDPVITLNVGGKIFMAYKSVLVKSGLLKGMLEDAKHSEETIFIGRSPSPFKHVLGYLIDKEYPYPSKYRSELDYFRIKTKNINFYDKDGVIISATREFQDIVQSSLEELSSSIEDSIKEMKDNTPDEQKLCRKNGCKCPPYKPGFCLNHQRTCWKKYCIEAAYDSQYCRVHS